MAENWLSTVNSRGYEPYSKSYDNNLIIEENEVGAPNSRQRSTTPRSFYQFDMFFSKTEWDLLFQWVRFNLASGSLPFMFPHPENWTDNPAQYKKFRFAVERMAGSWYSSYQIIGGEIKITTIMEGLEDAAI